MVEVVAADEFREWYEDELDDAAGRAVFEMVAKLEQFGTQLPFPLSSALNGSKYALRELRVKASGDQLRIAYAFDPSRDAVLLMGAAKAGDDRFYAWFIPKAEKIWEQYLLEQGVKP
ncbi:MAG: hypothetical protein RLZZ450_2664 [Pseudomonadota bacterium]|jgi:hypothetical protein